MSAFHRVDIAWMAVRGWPSSLDGKSPVTVRLKVELLLRYIMPRIDYQAQRVSVPAVRRMPTPMVNSTPGL